MGLAAFSDNVDSAALFDVDAIDPAQALSREFSTDAMMARSIARMPRRETLDAIAVVNKATQSIKQRLAEYLAKNPKKVLAPNDIAEMFKDAK